MDLMDELEVEESLKRDFETMLQFEEVEEDSSLASKKRGRFILPYHVSIRTVSGAIIRMEFSNPRVSIRELKYLLNCDHGLVDFRLLLRHQPTSTASSDLAVMVSPYSSSFRVVTHLDDLYVESGTVIYLVFLVVHSAKCVE